jgi:hypothetical protein
MAARSIVLFIGTKEIFMTWFFDLVGIGVGIGTIFALLYFAWKSSAHTKDDL